MRSAAAVIALGLIVAGCARANLAMFPGEKTEAGTLNPTGAVAVLDPASGDEIGVVETANSRARLGGDRVVAKPVDPAKLNARYGGVFGSMPQPPRMFVLYFKLGTSDLVPESAALIPALFEEVKARPGVDVEIIGHTDTTGDGTLNDGLSLKRAGEVRDTLVAMGLDGRIASIAGRGERELREPTADNVASELNRRVEVYVK